MQVTKQSFTINRPLSLLNSMSGHNRTAINGQLILSNYSWIHDGSMKTATETELPIISENYSKLAVVGCREISLENMIRLDRVESQS